MSLQHPVVPSKPEPSRGMAEVFVPLALAADRKSRSRHAPPPKSEIDVIEFPEWLEESPHPTAAVRSRSPPAPVVVSSVPSAGRRVAAEHVANPLVRGAEALRPERSEQRARKTFSATGEQTMVGPLFGPNRGTGAFGGGSNPLQGPEDDVDNDPWYDGDAGADGGAATEQQQKAAIAAADFSRDGAVWWLPPVFSPYASGVVEDEFRVYYYANRMMPLTHAVLSVLAFIAANALYASRSVDDVIRGVNIGCIGLWAACSVGFWRLKRDAELSDEKNVCLLEQTSTISNDVGDNNVKACSTTEVAPVAEEVEGMSEFSASATGVEERHVAGRAHRNAATTDVEDFTKKQATTAATFLLAKTSTIRHHFRRNASFHEWIAVVIHIGNFVFGFGNVLITCPSESIGGGGQEREGSAYSICYNIIQGDSFMLGSIACSAFLCPLRTVKTAPLYVVLGILFFALKFVPFVPYSSTAMQFWSMMILVSTEMCVCLVASAVREQRRRVNFEFHVQRHLRGLEVERIRRQVERMTSVQLPVELLHKPQVLRSAESYDTADAPLRMGPTYRPGRRIAQEHAFVCLISVGGLSSWSTTRGPSDAVEMLQALCQHWDSLLNRVMQSGTVSEIAHVRKVHMLGDQYMVVAVLLKHRASAGSGKGAAKTVGDVSTSSGTAPADTVTPRSGSHHHHLRRLRRLMAVFASRCLETTQQVATSLAASLPWPAENSKGIAGEGSMTPRIALCEGPAGYTLVPQTNNVVGFGPAVVAACELVREVPNTTLPSGLSRGEVPGEDGKRMHASCCGVLAANVRNADRLAEELGWLQESNALCWPITDASSTTFGMNSLSFAVGQQLSSEQPTQQLAVRTDSGESCGANNSNRPQCLDGSLTGVDRASTAHLFLKHAVCVALRRVALSTQAIQRGGSHGHRSACRDGAESTSSSTTAANHFHSFDSRGLTMSPFRLIASTTSHRGTQEASGSTARQPSSSTTLPLTRRLPDRYFLLWLPSAAVCPAVASPPGAAAQVSDLDDSSTRSPQIRPATKRGTASSVAALSALPGRHIKPNNSLQSTDSAALTMQQARNATQIAASVSQTGSPPPLQTPLASTFSTLIQSQGAATVMPSFVGPVIPRSSDRRPPCSPPPSSKVARVPSDSGGDVSDGGSRCPPAGTLPFVPSAQDLFLADVEGTAALCAGSADDAETCEVSDAPPGVTREALLLAGRSKFAAGQHELLVREGSDKVDGLVSVLPQSVDLETSVPASSHAELMMPHVGHEDRQELSVSVSSEIDETALRCADRRVRIELRYGVASVFVDDRTEREYQEFVKTNGYNYLDALLSFGSSLASSLAFFGFVWIIDQHRLSISDAGTAAPLHRPLVWTIPTVVLCCVALLVSTLAARAGIAAPKTSYALVPLSFVIQSLYIVPLLTASPEADVLFESQVVFAIIMLNWSIHRPMLATVVWSAVRDTAVFALLFVRCYVLIPLGSRQTNSGAAMLISICFAVSVVVRFLRERGRRESFAMEKVLDYQQEEVETDYTELERTLQLVVPDGVAGHLLRRVRERKHVELLQKNEQHVRQSGTGDDASRSRRAARRLLHPLWSASCNLQTDEAPFFILQVDLSSIEGGAHSFSSNSLAAAGSRAATFAISTAILEFIESLEISSELRGRVQAVECTHDAILVVALPREDPNAIDDYDELRAYDLLQTALLWLRKLFAKHPSLNAAVKSCGGAAQNSPPSAIGPTTSKWSRPAPLAAAPAASQEASRFLFDKSVGSSTQSLVTPVLPRGEDAAGYATLPMHLSGSHGTSHSPSAVLPDSCALGGLISRMLIDVGPAMGAVLGQQGVSFGYYGGAVLAAVDTLRDVPWGTHLASSRFCDLVALNNKTPESVAVVTKTFPHVAGKCRYRGSASCPSLGDEGRSEWKSVCYDPSSDSIAALRHVLRPPGGFTKRVFYRLESVSSTEA